MLTCQTDKRTISAPSGRQFAPPHRSTDSPLPSCGGPAPPFAAPCCQLAQFLVSPEVRFPTPLNTHVI